MSISTPHIKFEHSPAESLVDSFDSTPGDQYSSLFDSMDPREAMTPQSLDEDSMFGGSVRENSMAETPAPEKKPVKKRKSWGQQLPEPKTNLPPRKRAKTEDEKEQRRVERVLRNRRAAQSSRERKRQEVEALESEKRSIERRAQDLEMRLADMEHKFMLAQQQIQQLTGGSSIKSFRGSSVASSPRSVDQLRQTSPVTFSQELFTSQDTEKRPSFGQQSMDLHTPPPATVNPASLSPEMRPVDDSNASSSDMTQHPAAMLCDLQCQSKEQRPWMTSTAAATTTLSQALAMISLLTMSSTSISTFLLPLAQILTSLTSGSRLPPTPSILSLIILMATTAASLTTSSSTTSSTKTTSHNLRPKFSLRIQLLRRLLSCSPLLARPLMHATREAMRLASDEQLTRDCLNGVVVSDRSDVSTSPSMEALMTMLWAIRCIDKERTQSPKPDAAEEIRQVCGELDDYLKARKIREQVSVSRDRHDTIGEKSLEGWRTEF